MISFLLKVMRKFCQKSEITKKSRQIQFIEQLLKMYDDYLSHLLTF